MDVAVRRLDRRAAPPLASAWHPLPPAGLLLRLIAHPGGRARRALQADFFDHIRNRRFLKQGDQFHETVIGPVEIQSVLYLLHLARGAPLGRFDPLQADSSQFALAGHAPQVVANGRFLGRGRHLRKSQRQFARQRIDVSAQLPARLDPGNRACDRSGV
jgi:hypothetical protein